jgi:hypothetical protein
LRISDGSLVARPSGRISQAFFHTEEMRHSSNRLVINRAMVLPAWMNVRTVVTDGPQMFGVVLAWWELARVARSLRVHGFLVREVRTLLPMSFDSIREGLDES